MAEQYLTEARFDKFEEKFDKFIVDTEHRITTLEVNQSHAGWIATWLSGIIATVMTAAILAFGRLFGRD